MTETSVIILVCDGLGVRALDRAFARGDVPALSALRDEGGCFALTTVFPSVTGVAYLPMLTGRFPGSVGVPGLRWYDRSRGLSRWLGHSRSYVGPQLRRIDADLDAHAGTIAELVPGHSLGAQAMVTRGWSPAQQVERGAWFAARGIRAHIAGDVTAWARLEEELADRFVSRVRRERPRFAFAAFVAGDKATHALGGSSVAAGHSLRVVDDVAARLRRDAERDGRWRSMHLWIVSDHGHSPVSGHYELADAVRAAGVRVRAHPWTIPDRSEAAVMVSGNGMAHIYVDLATRERRCWPVLQPAWEARLGPVLDHPAVDVVATLRSRNEVAVWRRKHGSAVIRRENGLFSYRPEDGDPLQVGGFERLGANEAHERSLATDYPDASVQLADLVLSSRSGDVVVSAAPGWDLRRRNEPVEHVSSHGALHRAHMEVPLVVGRRPAVTPLRTVDIFPSVLRALNVAEPTAIDGRSFLHPDPASLTEYFPCVQ